ncbi:TPA: adenosylmethionine decarboxylase [bacterium]|nr:adenosylmethionine decarboxylase [bacterium]
MQRLSRHLLIELFGCDRSMLDNLETVRRILIETVSRSGATRLKEAFHKFTPQGVSGVILVAESHFSVHTWPEYGYAACDIFTCGETIKTEEAVKYLKEEFRVTDSKVIEVKRGKFGSFGMKKAG